MEVSKDVIKHNKERYQKEIIAFNENQGKIELKKPFNESEEANIIALKIEESKRLGNKYSDTAILYRTNMESRSFIDAFIRKRFPLSF